VRDLDLVRLRGGMDLLLRGGKRGGEGPRPPAQRGPGGGPLRMGGLRRIGLGSGLGTSTAAAVTSCPSI